MQYPMCCINPTIISRSEDMYVSPEGCLSFPGINGKVQRNCTIDVEYYGELWRKQKATLEGLVSICFQHEYDHLMGIVFTEKFVDE